MKIGDVITITDTGCIYPTYKEMADKLMADSDKWQKNRLGSRGMHGRKAEVLNINKDRINTSSCHILIEMIEGINIGEQYVIGMDGVKLDMAATILGDDLFEI